MHLGNRVGHVQGGLTMHVALATAVAAVPQHPVLKGASAWYISPGQGKALTTRSTRPADRAQHRRRAHRGVRPRAQARAGGHLQSRHPCLRGLWQNRYPDPPTTKDQHMTIKGKAYIVGAYEHPLAQSAGQVGRAAARRSRARARSKTPDSRRTTSTAISARATRRAPTSGAWRTTWACKLRHVDSTRHGRHLLPRPRRARRAGDRRWASATSR